MDTWNGDSPIMVDKREMSPELQRAERQFRRLSELNSVRVLLSIKSDKIAPEEITRRLNLKPSHSVRPSDVVYKDERYEIKADQSLWFMDSAYHLKSKWIEDHMEWLVNEQLYDKRLAIQELQNDGAEIGIKGHMDTWSYLAHPELSVETIQRLAQLKIGLSFIIRFRNNDSDY